MSETTTYAASAKFLKSSFGGSFKRPKSTESILSGFFFRFLIAMVVSISSSIIILGLALLNDGEISHWVIVITLACAMITTYIGEGIRSNLFERIVISKNPKVEWELDQNGLLIDGRKISFYDLKLEGAQKLDSRKVATNISKHYEKILYNDDKEKNNYIKGSIYSIFGKRVLDVFLVLLAVPCITPLIFLLAMLVKLDGGPAFYTQDRIGKGGKIFRIYKLRTMVINADAKLENYISLNPEARLEWEVNQKLHYDPRITQIGRLLRKTSLDELPQLWNVLRGDMSLVGPRPILPMQRALYPGRLYFTVCPGLTGPWQISNRNNMSFASRAVLDDNYVREMSFLRDLTTMILTVFVVFKEL